MDNFARRDGADRLAFFNVGKGPRLLTKEAPRSAAAPLTAPLSRCGLEIGGRSVAHASALQRVDAG